MAKHLNEWKTHVERIDALSELDFNYDYQVYEKSTDKLGWNIDRYRASIAKERPGPPEPNGPFSRAKRALENYEFPDPRLITAIYRPGPARVGRNMLMKARFLGFTFYFGVRITAVIDEDRTDESGRPCRVWGYAYRTLKGHFEVGEIRFELWKDKLSGEVSFHIDAYSRPDHIPQVLYRWGFSLFGRPLQKYFARSAIERLQEIAG